MTSSSIENIYHIWLLEELIDIEYVKFSQPDRL